MSSEVLARQAGKWRVVCLAPDVCKTPMGPAMVPVPYPATAKLVSSQSTVKSVRANGEPVVVFDQTMIPSTQGDGAGSGTGIKSGTVGGKCYPKTHSKTVKAKGKLLVRHNDQFWMNG
jgi:hypothetical protein